MLVQKKARQVRAWCLGEGSDMEQALTAQGKLRLESDGSYRVCSQESPDEGQIAQPGDYIKVDSTGAPYPNRREYFLENHTWIKGDLYLQTCPVLKAWNREEEICPEVEYLLGSGRLRINESDPSRYYNAFLWGAWLHAAADAVIIFDHEVTPKGGLCGINFRFITREEFDLTYQVIDV